MTTTVTIKTHDWPVEVQFIEDTFEEGVTKVTSVAYVPADSQASYAVWQNPGRSLLIRELPKDFKIPS